jgi:formylglycine-generating enzyme required for sulfatase activity
MPFRWACAYGEDRIGLWQAFEVNGVRQILRWIPPGEFLMGSPDSEKERDDNERQHLVILTQGYWLAETTCTQALWETVMGENPSHFKNHPQNPVEQVSWDDVVERFLPKLNKLVPGLKAELPTEVQWEYACRAGTQAPFWFGEQITTEQVNYDGNDPYVGSIKGKYIEKTVPVKALPANDWCLYQMHGNVYEWCADWWGEYLDGEVVDPKGPTEPQKQESRERVLRGGCWASSGKDCRSASRIAIQPSDRHYIIGFRLARAAC